MSFADRLTGGVSSLLLRQIVEAVAGIVAAITLIRYFGPEDYGLLALALAAVEIGALLTGAFEEAIRRFVPEHVATGRSRAAMFVVRLALDARLGLSLAVAVGMVLAAPFLAGMFGADARFEAAAAAAAFLLLPKAGNAVVTSLLIALERYRAIAALSLVGGGVSLGSALATAAFGLSVAEFLALTAFVQSVIAGVLLVWAIRGIPTGKPGAEPPVEKSVEIRRTWSYTWPLWGSAASYTTYKQGSKILLGMIAPVAVVGYFSVAKNIVERLTGLYYQLPAALLPSLSNRMAREGAERANAVVARLSTWVLAGAFSLALAVLCLSPELILVFGGATYKPAVAILAIFSAQFLFRLPSSLWGTLYYLHEHTRSLLWMNIARVGPLLVMLLIFTPVWGGPGAATAEAASYAISLGLFVVYVPRTFDIAASVVFGRIVRAVLLLAAAGYVMVSTDWSILARYGLVLGSPLLLVMGGLVDQHDLDDLRSVHLTGRATRTARSFIYRILSGLFRLTRVGERKGRP